MTIPDLHDEVQVLYDFVATDIEHTLERITLTLRKRRSQTGWKASELKDLKYMRASLHRFLEAARTNKLTPFQHAEIDTLLTAATQLNLASVHDQKL